MTRLILIRHAHTESNGGNPDPAMSGWTDHPLSSQGRRQLDALRERFDGQPGAAALYSSPLTRARSTAAVLVQQSRQRLRVLPDLQEINCGAVDGLRVSVVRQQYPQFWDANLRQDDENFRWPGGESYREFRWRTIACLDAIAARHTGQCVLVVTHAGLIGQACGSLHGLSAARWESYRPENTSLTELEWGERRSIVRFNDHSHLLQPLAC